MLSFRHTDIFVNEEIMLVCCSSKSSYSYALLNSYRSHTRL